MYVDIFHENFTTYMAIWKEIKFNVLTDFIAFWQRKNFIFMLKFKWDNFYLFYSKSYSTR